MNKDLENSENFINQKTGKETGFTVSSDYFETVENNFSARLFEEINDRSNSFEMPMDYFNNLEDLILEKSRTQKTLKKVINFKQRVLEIIPLSAAASIMLFIGLQIFSTSNSGLPAFNSISNNEIEKWLESNTEEINIDDISLIFSENDLIESDFAFTDINNINIETYIDSNDDLTLINELY